MNDRYCITLDTTVLCSVPPGTYNILSPSHTPRRLRVNIRAGYPLVFLFPFSIVCLTFANPRYIHHFAGPLFIIRKVRLPNTIHMLVTKRLKNTAQYTAYITTNPLGLGLKKYFT